MKPTASSLRSLAAVLLRKPAAYVPDPGPDVYAAACVEWRLTDPGGSYEGPVPPVGHGLHPLLSGAGKRGSRLQSGAGWTRSMETLRPALDAFARDEVRVWAWKGLDYALSLYPTPWVRPMYDFDLLVEKEYLDRVLSILTGLGWRTRAEETHAFRTGRVSELRLFRSGALLEVHTHPFYYPSLYPGRLPETLFAPGRELLPGLLRFSPEHGFLLALLHHCQQPSTRQIGWVDEALLAAEAARAGAWPGLGAALAATRLGTEMGTLLGVIAGFPGTGVPEGTASALVAGGRGPDPLLALFRAGSGMPTLASLLSLHGGRRLSYAVEIAARVLLPARRERR